MLEHYHHLWLTFGLDFLPVRLFARTEFRRTLFERVVCVGKSDAPDLTGGTNMSGIDCLTLVTRNLLQARTDRPSRRKLSSNHPSGSPWLAQRGVRSSTSMNNLVLTYPPVDETDRRCPYPHIGFAYARNACSCMHHVSYCFSVTGIPPWSRLQFLVGYGSGNTM